MCVVFLLFSIEFQDSTTSNSTGSSSGNETDLSTRRSISTDSRWDTDVLLVTTTERMVNWIHGNTSNSGPSLSESLHLVEDITSLEDWLINSFTGSNQTNHSSGFTGEGLSGTRRKLNSGLGKIIGVTNDDSTGTGSSSKLSLITWGIFDIADSSTFRDLVDGEDVTGGQRSFVSSIDELTGVHSFNSQEVASSESVLIRVSEDDLGEGSTTTRIVEDFSDDTLDVTISFSEIENSESSGGDSVMLVSLEDTVLLTSSTTSDDFTHYE